MADVSLDGVAKSYGGARAVDGVTLAIAAGEFVTLLGPSGCGKTTTLRMIAGLVAPDAGRIAIGGADVTALPAHRRDIGMVFQSHALFPHMSVAENVGFGLRMRGVARADRAPKVRAALEMVRLDDLGARAPSQLSGGQQQRVALARALVFNPRVLLLDEPFGALDRKLREAMQAELRALTRRLGMTAVFVTHDQEEALILSDRVGLMNAGRIEQVGAPEAIFERPASRFVADFMGFGNCLDAVAIDAARLDAGGVTLAPDQPHTATGRVAVAIRAERIDLARAPKSGPNTAAGVVTRAAYHGTMTTWHVRLDRPEGMNLLARAAPRSSADSANLVVGTRVWASWAPSAVIVLAR